MKIKHCLSCSGLLIQKDSTQYTCRDCAQDFWNNPKAAVSVIIFNHEKILFAERAEEPMKGSFDLPGGFLNYNEDPIVAARREIKEELSIELGTLKLIGAYTHEYTTDISSCDLVYLAQSWNGEIIPGDDVAGHEWHDINFFDDKKCAWHYPGLISKLSKIQKGTNAYH